VLPAAVEVEEVLDMAAVEVADVPPEEGRSVAFHASWIMGASTVMMGGPLSLLGSVTKKKSLVLLLQLAMGRTVDAAIERQVWVLPSLSHVNPSGQQPTKVSPASIDHCNCHPVVPPAMAVQAEVYPAGQMTPGE
jgi:hypothetical protein